MAVGLDLNVGEREGGIRETETKFVDGCLIVAVKRPIVYENSSFKIDLRRELAGVVNNLQDSS